MNLNDVDWTDLASVWTYACQLGSGMAVVKHDNRPNFNICHAERTDLWDKPDVTLMGVTKHG